MVEWKLEQIKLNELKENPKNPRRISKFDGEHLQTSLEKFGLCEPIVVNTDNLIIGGHQRAKTLKKLKYKVVDVYKPTETLDEKQVEELSIRLNKNTGEFDYDILANEWDIEDLLDWGFTEEDLQCEDKDVSEEKEKLSILIKFKSYDQLSEAEEEISKIVDKFQGVKYEIKN